MTDTAFEVVVPFAVSYADDMLHGAAVNAWEQAALVTGHRRTSDPTVRVTNSGTFETAGGAHIDLEANNLRAAIVTGRVARTA